MQSETTIHAVSSGGVAYRTSGERLEIALISVGNEPRWQLPKGMVDPGETEEITAVREVREEAGIDTELLEPIDTIEYYFYARKGPARVRIHKTVHFFLLRYCSGDPVQHDHEVNEARWVEIDEAVRLLTYESEKRVVLRAKEQVAIQ